MKILKILKKDAKTPFTQIGNDLGIADSTVHIRVKKMIDEGIICKFTIKVIEEALGNVSCMLMIDVVPGHFEGVVSELIKSEHVDEILELQGKHVAILKLSASSLAELREEIVRIRKIPNMMRTEMATILKTWKTE
jgi:Lrp/AsnC family transcriptional regulator, regulator for asnA, asnC and gidA